MHVLVNDGDASIDVEYKGLTAAQYYAKHHKGKKLAEVEETFDRGGFSADAFLRTLLEGPAAA